MKIIHVISSISPGGAEVFLRDLAIQQAKSGNEVLIYAIYPSNNLEFEKEFIDKVLQNNINVIKFNKKRNSEKLKTFMDVRNMVRKHRPDVINTHIERLACTFAIATFGLKCKIITTIHSVVIADKDMKILNKFINLNLINSCITICNQSEEMVRTYGISKVSTIENGIDVEKFSLNRHINLDVKNIVCIGRLEEVKNQKMLVEAYKIVHKQLSDKSIEVPKLNIYGDGSLKKELLDKIYEENLEKCIELKGHCNNIVDVLKNSDIYVMPSIYEGLSISLIEALVTKIPMIVTDVGGNSNIVVDDFNGILIKNKDTKNLAEALLKLILNYEDRVRMSFNSEKFINKFDIKNTSQKYLRYYKE